MTLETLALEQRARLRFALCYLLQQGTWTEKSLEARVREELGRIQPALSAFDREMLVGEVLAELLGLGPLSPLLRDPEVRAIRILADLTTQVFRKERWVQTNMKFETAEHLQGILERLEQPVVEEADGALRIDRPEWR